MDKRIKILIIDDEVHIRKFLRISFEAENYIVEEVSSGTDGVVSTKLCKHLQSLIRISFPVGEGFPS